jgi:cytochrome c2
MKIALTLLLALYGVAFTTQAQELKGDAARGATLNASCIGCHGLSKDGTKMALTLDSGDGRGTIYSVADYAVLVPFASNPQYWNFATFTPTRPSS